MLSSYIFTMVIYSSWINPLIIMKCFSLFLITVFILKSILSDRSIGTPAFFLFFFFNLLEVFYFIFYFFISWRLITLQYCSGFCHTLTWISHGFTCIPHPDPPTHHPLHPIPLGLPSAPGRALVSCIQPGLVIHFTLDNIHVSMLFSLNIIPSPSPIESKILFCTSICKTAETFYHEQQSHWGGRLGKQRGSGAK